MQLFRPVTNESVTLPILVKSEDTRTPRLNAIEKSVKWWYSLSSTEKKYFGGNSSSKIIDVVEIEDSNGIFVLP